VRAQDFVVLSIAVKAAAPEEVLKVVGMIMAVVRGDLTSQHLQASLQPGVDMQVLLFTVHR
jgi:hypothetical protein